jgi:hypothetical protein
MAFFHTFSPSYDVILLNVLENGLQVSKKSGKVYSNSNLRIYILPQYVHCDFVYRTGVGYLLQIYIDILLESKSYINAVVMGIFSS